MPQQAEISPRKIAALRKQLAATNARLLSLERERRQLKNDIACLTAWLRRGELEPRAAGRNRPLQLGKARHPR